MEATPKVIEKLKKIAILLFSLENSGHDSTHHLRVFNIAMRLQAKEGGDPLVIGAASLIHDIHRVMQSETKQYCDPIKSLPKAIDLLTAAGLPEEKMPLVLHCIEYHEECGFDTNGKTTREIEVQIIQDADNLDMMGAVGIARAFVYAGANGIPIWTPEIPLEVMGVDASWQDPSEIHHFYRRLLKLEGDMNTRTAKKIARRRHRALEVFLKEFFAECEGKA